MIMTHIRTSLILAAGLLLTACGSATYVTSGSRVLIDSRYDAHPDSAAAAFIAPYKARVDSIMNPIVGYAATDMSCHQPESSQSNLYTDILVWSSSKFNEHPDFGVYNVGGIRAALSKGAVTVGDILDTAPFENKICFLTLSGDKVLELFRQITGQGGQGLSHSVRLVMDKRGRLLSAKINGRDVDPKASYRIVTLDYIAQGNDKMEAFKAKTAVVSPQSEENNVRYLIMDYFRTMMKEGRKVESKVEGRITVAPDSPTATN